MSLTVGNDVTGRSSVDGWRNYCTIDRNNLIPEDMTITHFLWYAKRAGPRKVQLWIYRKIGNQFARIGTSPRVLSKVGHNRLQINPINAKKGDLIGFYVEQDGVIAFHMKDGQWQRNGLAGSAWFTESINNGGKNNVFPFSSNRVYSIAVQGEPVAKKEPKIIISEIFYDGLEKGAEGDEYIEITNIGDAPGNISGYRINADDKKQDFTFPDDTILSPGQCYRVYTNYLDLSTGGFTFGYKRAIWNNKAADTGRIYDANGKLVDDFTYSPPV
jgi:hypothetical protein